MCPRFDSWWHHSNVRAGFVRLFFLPMTKPVLVNTAEALELALRAALPAGAQLFCLADLHTQSLCLPALGAFVREEDFLLTAPGEAAKSVETSNRLWLELASRHAERQAVLINLGGGVITDLGGWLASTYKRGIPFIHIPTSLLGMADAAIGGKTALNAGPVKNLIGTWAEARAILIHPPFLRTLPKKEIRSGCAEMLKHGLIREAAHWEAVSEAMERGTPGAGEVYRSACIKWEIASADPRETGVRKLLNFGHTFGHALEAHFLDTDNPLTHGDAIAAGMVVETVLSEHRLQLDPAASENIVARLLHFFPVRDCLSVPLDRILGFMAHDKKISAGIHHFSLLQSPGHGVFGVPCTTDEIIRAWQEANRRISA